MRYLQSRIIGAFVGLAVCCAGVAGVAPAETAIKYDRENRTIIVESGQATLEQIAKAVGDPAVFRRAGTTSVMTATLRIAGGAGVSMKNETLKFNCSKMVEFGIMNHGSLRIEKSHVTSVNKDARGWIKNDGKKGGGYAFNVTDSEFSLLGFIDNRPESSIPIKRRRAMGTFWYPITCVGKTTEPLVFSRNVVHNCDLAMWLWHTSEARITDNTFRDIGAFIAGDYYPNPAIRRISMGNNFGIVDFSAGNDLLFARNKVHDVRRTDEMPAGHIIRATGEQKNLVIEKNEIYNCDGDMGILLKHSSNAIVRDNYIHDVTHRYSSGCGIVIYKGYREGLDTVVNNRVENCRSGISAMYDAGKGNIITGNWVYGCYKGITLSGTSDNVVADNIFSSCIYYTFKVGDTRYRGRNRVTKNLLVKDNLLCGEKAPTIDAKGDVKLVGNVMLANDQAARPGAPEFRIFLIPRTAEVGEKVTFIVVPLEPLAGKLTAAIEAPGLKKKLVMKLDRFRGPKKTICGEEPKNRFLFAYKCEFDTRGAKPGKAKITLYGKDKGGEKGSVSAEFTIVAKAK